MRFTKGPLSTVLLAIAITTGMVAQPASAAPGPKIDWHRVQAATLTAKQITNASGTGFTAQTMGINCTVRGPDGATACWQKYPHSEEALRANQPWVTHVAVMAFPTSSKANNYLKQMAKRFKGSVTATGTGKRLEGTDPQSHLSDGLTLWMGPETSVVQTVGSEVVWAACGVVDGKAPTQRLATCAESVANAQLKRLP